MQLSTSRTTVYMFLAFCKEIIWWFLQIGPSFLHYFRFILKDYLDILRYGHSHYSSEGPDRVEEEACIELSLILIKANAIRRLF
jgi:hypothetical protein